MNNVKQIGLALNNHIASLGYLPPGVKVSELYHGITHRELRPLVRSGHEAAGISGASWMLYILPFMEHNDIYDHWNFTHSVLASITPSPRPTSGSFIAPRGDAPCGPAIQ